MKILVIGGGGFLGTELVTELAKNRSNQLQVLDCFTHGFPKVVKKKRNIQPPVVANIANFRDILRVMERFKPEVVFHLAAFNSRPETFGNFKLCAETNYVGSANVIHAITSLRQPPRRVVFASSLAAKDPQSHFGISKRAAEDLFLSTLARFTQYDVQVNIVRFAEIYGPSSVYTSSSMVNFLVDNMLLGQDIAMYGVKESIDSVHISTAVSACVQLLEKDCKELIIDVGTGCGMPIVEMIDAVKKATNYSGRLRYLENPKVPVRTYIASTAVMKDTLGITPEDKFEEHLTELVKKRRKVLG